MNGIATHTQLKAGATGTYPAIQCVNLTKKFGKRVSVDGLSFSVRPGELYALLGDNGAGKTTTINMLTTVLQPSSGSFAIAGFDGVKFPEQAKAAFGVVSQEVAVYAELTAYENLNFIADLYAVPAKNKHQRICDLLEASGLAERAHDQAGRFSTGMQRKLSIALALVRQPRVIFMDEPTVGLDPAARRQIWQTLANLKNNDVTILLTTHYLDEAEVLADRIGIIRAGKMIMEGTIDELRDQLRVSSAVKVGLSEAVRSADCAAITHRLFLKYGLAARFDEFRRTLIFTMPSHEVLAAYLSRVLDSLTAEGIAFEQFGTTAPSLEEIFLNLRREQLQ